MKSQVLAAWAAMALPGAPGRTLERAQTSMRKFKPPRSMRYLKNVPPKTLKALWLGLLSLGLYALLFMNERLVLELSVKYWWSFLVPTAIAFVFSFAHGAFTGAFWDAVGLKPKTTKKS
jgi:hypothetical protein